MYLMPTISDSYFARSFLRWLAALVIVSAVVVIAIAIIALVFAVSVIVPRALLSLMAIDQVAVWNARNYLEVSILLAREISSCLVLDFLLVLESW
jgi:hypothetical protein